MLPRKNRVTTPLFGDILTKSRLCSGGFATLRLFQNNLKTSRFSTVVTKKVIKTAVGRNRLKRRVNEIILPLLKQAGFPAVTAVLFAKKGLENLNFQELTLEISQILKKAGVVR